MKNVNDTCKETLTVLAYLNNNLIEKIPSKVLKGISELAADSKIDFYIDKEKNLESQNISEESKDLISLIYYNYATNENEKEELFKLWNQNENQYQEELKEKYDLDKMFQNKKNENTESEAETKSNVSIIQYKKETIFDKIKNFFKNILK